MDILCCIGGRRVADPDIGSKVFFAIEYSSFGWSKAEMTFK
jgi:hypothetical protein